jgi:hypothetical protein
VPCASDLALGFVEKVSGDPAPPGGGRDVHLLHLVPVEHHEPDDGAVELSHRRVGGVGDPLPRAGEERLVGPHRHQLLGHVAQVPVPPATGPDGGDRLGVLAACGAHPQGGGSDAHRAG